MWVVAQKLNPHQIDCLRERESKLKDLLHILTLDLIIRR